VLYQLSYVPVRANSVRSPHESIGGLGAKFENGVTKDRPV